LNWGLANREDATHKQDNTNAEYTQTSTPRVGFEPMFPAFEYVKTVHAVDRAAIVIGHETHYHILLCDGSMVTEPVAMKFIDWIIETVTSINIR
jgi:hypothetical protein